MDRRHSIQMFSTRARYYSGEFALALLLAASVSLPLWVFGAAADKPDVSRDLRDSKASKRLAALERLTYGRGRAPEAKLLEALSAEPNPELRARLLNALTAAATPGAGEALARALDKDPSPLVRSVA